MEEPVLGENGDVAVAGAALDGTDGRDEILEAVAGIGTVAADGDGVEPFFQAPDGELAKRAGLGPRGEVEGARDLDHEHRFAATNLAENSVGELVGLRYGLGVLEAGLEACKAREGEVRWIRSSGGLTEPWGE